MLSLRCLILGSVFALIVSRHLSAYGQTTEDQVLANAALIELHDLARAAAQYQQATKDDDKLGCDDSYVKIQMAAHNALTDMHLMSVEPSDSIESVSSLLRVSALMQTGSFDQIFDDTLLMSASQAIVELRYDYAAEGDWYSVNSDGSIKDMSPLKYAQLLRAQNYSWVSVRPKDLLFIEVGDWKAELASFRADDPSIENSGESLSVLEVDYRESTNDVNTSVFFYRDKGAAQAAADNEARQALSDAMAAETLELSKIEWDKKLYALPYIIRDNEAGFKIVYQICKGTTDENFNGWGMCSDGGSHDWSAVSGEPYQFFPNLRSCNDEISSINVGSAESASIERKNTGVLKSICVPAEITDLNLAKGYRLVFGVSAPGVSEDEVSFGALRQIGLNVPVLFKSYNACFAAASSIYQNFIRDLGVDDDGTVLNDRTVYIQFGASCSQVY